MSTFSGCPARLTTSHSDISSATPLGTSGTVIDCGADGSAPESTAGAVAAQNPEPSTRSSAVTGRTGASLTAETVRGAMIEKSGVLNVSKSGKALQAPSA